MKTIVSNVYKITHPIPTHTTRPASPSRSRVSISSVCNEIRYLKFKLNEIEFSISFMIRAIRQSRRRTPTPRKAYVRNWYATPTSRADQHQATRSPAVQLSYGDCVSTLIYPSPEASGLGFGSVSRRRSPLTGPRPRRSRTGPPHGHTPQLSRPPSRHGCAPVPRCPHTALCGADALM